LSTRKLARLAAVTLLFAVMAGLNLPGCPWFPMMKYQQSRDGFSFDTDDYDAEGAKRPSMRLPVPGTVPVDGGDPIVTLLDADQKLTNPVRLEKASIDRGAEVYGNMCAPCHGAQGKGDGLVGKKFPFILPLVSDNAKKLSDATIFAIIRQGRGLMPAYGSRMTVQERWDTINFVRNLQGLNAHVLKSAAPAAPAPGAKPAP
jgi:mono/diheme cytochrome c family protein